MHVHNIRTVLERQIMQTWINNFTVNVIKQLELHGYSANVFVTNRISHGERLHRR